MPKNKIRIDSVATLVTLPLKSPQCASFIPRWHRFASHKQSAIQQPVTDFGLLKFRDANIADEIILAFNKKLSYCWETVRRESMPRIAEMDVEMTT